MKINGQNYVQFINQMYKKNSENKWEKRDKNDITKDRIEISKSSQDVKKYIDQMKQMESGNKEKIERIKESMGKGTYKVSSQKLAEIILDKMNKQNQGIGEE